MTVISVSRFLNLFFSPFDAVSIARKVSTECPRSSYYNIPQKAILKMWKDETQKGIKIHDFVSRGDFMGEKCAEMIGEWIHQNNFSVVKSEFAVVSQKLGIKGIIDAVLLDETSKEYILVDWKYSAANMERMRDFPFSIVTKGPFSGLPDNKFGRAMAQLQCYKLLMRNEHPEFPVAKMMIVQVHEKVGIKVFELD